MTLEEVGDALKAERERRGLRIEDVANQLKISPRLLTALETGNDAALPHPAYVRGFIRSYASMLGISQEEVHSWLENLGTPSSAKATGPQPKPESSRQPVQPAKAPPEQIVPTEPEQASVTPSALPKEKLDMPVRVGKKRNVFLPFLLLVLGAIAAGGWWAWQNGKLEFLKAAPAPTVDLDQGLPQAEAYMGARNAEEAKTEPAASPPPVATSEKAPETPAANVDLALPPVQIPAQPPAPPAQPKEETVAALPKPESHKLIITAVEECWVHSNADKTDTRQFSLRKGDTFALTFNKTLELKLGNAGGVRLRYDGEDLPPPGTSGQVRTISFPPAANADR